MNGFKSELAICKSKYVSMLVTASHPRDSAKMADKLSQTLTGYDCNFLSEPPDELKCLICLEVARDPRQHEECGKLFCSECIEKYGTDKPCPNCKKTGAQFYKDHRGRRNISELEVKCDSGCKWVGTVGTLQKHVDTCQFALVPCPKQCKVSPGKTKHIMRKDVDKHLKEDCLNRDYKCKHCGQKGTYFEITKIHDKTCEMKIVHCSKCNLIMPRRKVEEHIATTCEYTVVPCTYSELGCDMVLRRKDMAEHEENAQLHLHMAMKTTMMLKKMVSDTYNTLMKGEPIKFKFEGFQEMKDKKKSVTSPSYYTSPNGYHMALRVYPNGCGEGLGSHVSVYAVILKGRNDAKLKWPFVGKITFTLLNQLEDKNHLKMTAAITVDSEFTINIPRGFPKFIAHRKSGTENTLYLKDDALYFRMSVEVANHKPWLE